MDDSEQTWEDRVCDAGAGAVIALVTAVLGIVLLSGAITVLLVWATR